MKNKPSKEELENLYIKEGKTLEDLQKLYKISKTTLFRWLNEYDLRKKILIRPSKKVLYDLYIIQRKTQKELGNLYKVAEGTVNKWVRLYKIKKPKKNLPTYDMLYNTYIVQDKDIQDLCKYFGLSYFKIRKCLDTYKIVKIKRPKEQKQKRCYTSKFSKDFLYDLLVVQKKTKESICKEYHLSPKTLNKWIKEHNITREYLCYKRGNTEISYKVNHPLIAKDTLYYLYIDKNFRIEDIALKFSVSKRYIDSLLRKYDIRKPRDLAQQGVSLTCLKKYNAPSYFETKDFREKASRKWKLKYGCSCKQQVHIAKSSLEILNSKEKLEELIKSLYSKTYVSVAQNLGIRDSTAARYIKRYCLEHLLNQYISKPEQEIKDFFRDIKLHKVRKILNKKEIDLYSDEHKIGIEFNGGYWHSDKFRDKTYHINKSLEAQDKGVFLFHIFEYEWADTRVKKIILDRLQGLFDIRRTSILADKCCIKEVPINVKKDFLYKNHIKNNDKSGITLGLYENDSLIFIMTFVEFKNNKSKYKLLRFCSKLGYNVVGGASKLFKYFLKTYNPKSVVSYSDIGKDLDKDYRSLGFRQIRIIKPMCSWVKGPLLLPKRKCQPSYFIKKGWLKEGETKAIEQVMHEHNFYRIYDCGKKVWVWQS